MSRPANPASWTRTISRAERMRLWLALACASLAAAPVDELPPPSRVAERESLLATVASESRLQMHYVGAHADALEVYLRTAASLGLPPGPKPRIEAADVAGLPDVACTVLGGHVLVTVRLGDDVSAPARAGEAVARAWLAAAAVAGGRATQAPSAWAPPALASEVVAQLRPAMVDLWYREAAATPPPPLAEVVAGRAGPRESLLFLRALRRSLGASEFAGVLAAAGRGEPVEPVLAGFAKAPQAWWIATRQTLIDARPPLALGVRESLAELDALARFVHDPLGRGDVVLTGPQAARLRRLPALPVAMAERLARLRREILRQNPVAHNAWRSLGAWLEAYPTATEAELDRLWADYVRDRESAGRLAAEVDQAMSAPR